MKTLTIKQAEKKYLKHKGVYCPFCESNNLVTGDIDIVEGIAIQGCVCENCQAEWNDQYTLTGVTFDVD